MKKGNYTISKDGKILKKYIGKNKIVNDIPSTVKIIDDNAFYNSDIESIHIPENVTKIGRTAFMYSKVQEVVMEDSVTYIGIGAFSNCQNLKSVKLSKSLTKIEDSAFYNSSIQKIIIPENVTSIEKEAFKYCNELTEICIPPSVEEIGYEAFSPYLNIKTIYTTSEPVIDYFKKRCGNIDVLTPWCVDKNNKLFMYYEKR